MQGWVERETVCAYCITLSLLLLTGSKFSDFGIFLISKCHFVAMGVLFECHLDTWPVPHHSSDLCVMITFLARITSH